MEAKEALVIVQAIRGYYNKMLGVVQDHKRKWPHMVHEGEIKFWETRLCALDVAIAQLQQSAGR